MNAAHKVSLYWGGSRKGEVWRCHLCTWERTEVSLAPSQGEIVRETKECADFPFLLSLPLNSIASSKLHSEVIDSWFFSYAEMRDLVLLCITETNINGSWLVPCSSLIIRNMWLHLFATHLLLAGGILRSIVQQIRYYNPGNGLGHE